MEASHQFNYCSLSHLLEWGTVPKATVPTSQSNSSRSCPAESLELCQPDGSTELKVVDADFRSCRFERELFYNATGDNYLVDRCISFEGLANVSDDQWASVRIPQAYMAYPMDVDLTKVVLAHSYGLALNVKPINNLNISTVYSSKCVCKQDAANSYWTMIIVKSALRNYARRLQLREVIRRQAAKLGVKVGVLFSLGLSSGGQIPPDLLKEVTQFDDILLASYTDTYHNLTLKTISNLRFVHHHCLHTSPSFVYLDDDHGINLKQLHQFFSNVSLVEIRKSVFGFINYNKPVIRDTEHKWFTSISTYPFPHYPDYPIGPCYIIGADIIQKLSIAAAFTRLMPNEDVFVGMMLMKLGVTIQPLPNMRIHRSHFPRNFSPLVAGLISVLLVVFVFYSEWGTVPKATVPTSQSNSSRSCPAESLELCQPDGSTELKVVDADFRSCRFERELFYNATGDNYLVDRCISFEGLASVRIPQAYMAYPMDVDLTKVVLAHSYGLALNVKPINNLNISTVYSSKSVCKQDAANSYWTMIIVKSALRNYARRLQLREVIRRQAAKLGVKVGILFSLGLSSGGQIPPDLLKEVTQFDDILLASYTDTYHNLTLKTISNLRFVHHHCLHTSPSFVFLDDDHGINLKQLHQFFSNVSLVEIRKSVFGFINYNKPVIRDTEHKWFTSISTYPFPHYPDYPIGPCYIIGADIIQKLSIAAAFTRLMPNEDVFVGMMLMKLGVTIQPLPNMRIHRSHFPRNFSPLVAGLISVLLVVFVFYSEWGTVPKATVPTSQSNSSRSCPAESLELCQPDGSTELKVVDADFRSCRFERELFYNATGDNYLVDRCISFEGLASVRIPQAYMAYPMDVDLTKVVLAHSYGLALNVKPINNLNISTVYSSKSLCKQDAANSYWTMIIVKSALRNYARRLQLREVIRRQAAKLGVKVGILFSLGLSTGGQIPPDLLKEVTQFDDILLASYTDTYHNLTLKTISNLRFVHHHCLHTSPSFVFLDDDHGINLKQLHQFFSNVSLVEIRKSVFGFINYNKPVIRDTEHKWFTSISTYPFPHYPDYPIGPCYIIGADIIQKLSIAAAFTRLMPNEDVFVGMMLMKLGVTIQPLPNMRIHRSHFPRNFSPLVAGLKYFVRELDIL
ncbi:hypothetical protein SprV_0702308100 [Sparganum proliferum]